MCRIIHRTCLRCACVTRQIQPCPLNAATGNCPSRSLFDAHIPQCSSCRLPEVPVIISESPSEPNTTGALDDEALEAAFVACWPKREKIRSSTSIPPSRESLDRSCTLWLYDSYLADAWINANYDHQCVARLRENNVGGPVASMLSLESPALSIFGSISPSLVNMACDLADVSGFPVIIRPPNEDPSDRFRNRRALSPRCAAANQGSSGSEIPAQVKQSICSTGRSSQRGERGRHPGERNNRRTDETDSEEEDDPRPPPPPPPSPPHSNTLPRGEIVHKTDFSLGILVDDTDNEDFLDVITRVKFYPVPNAKEQLGGKAGKVAFEPSIESHVSLEIRTSPSVDIDNAAGSMEFWTRHTGYLHTARFLSLGYDKPPVQYTRTSNTQITHAARVSTGLTGGHLTAIADYNANKSRTSAIEAADDTVAKSWVVSPQHKRKDDANSRALDVIIRRGENQADARDMAVEYGMTVEIDGKKKIPEVSFVYRHQIHCWVAVESKAKTRGIIILTAHCIPDICTENEVWIDESPMLKLEYENMKAKGQEGDATAKQAGTSDGIFAFATAVIPGATSRKRRDHGILKAWRRTQKPETQVIPICNQVFRGWDHSNKKWLKPVWPKLDHNLAMTNGKVDWSLLWECPLEEENSETAMICD